MIGFVFHKLDFTENTAGKR